MTGSTTDMATEAGLRHVSGEEPGIRRIKRGHGFSYVNPDGSVVAPAVREWIKSLAVPPAWSDVWISRDDTAHILATGYDDAGRKQYIYHPGWEDIRDEVKFDRVGQFGRRLSTLRRRIDSDLREPGLNRPKVVALAVAVLDRTLIRVGNAQYVDANESYGLTTLTPEHVEVNGSRVRLEFAGKGGADQQVAFFDPRLSRLIARCEEVTGQTLFSYENEHGTGAITSTDVNAYLADTTGRAFTAKELRTWGATSIVTGELGRRADATGEPHRDFLEAVDVAAEKLGNTREICRSSYVHPLTREAYVSGQLADVWRRAHRGKWVSRPESAVNLLLSSNT